MSKKDVFISYKAEEFNEAAFVKSVLEQNGISCWMAPMCIKGGSSYAVEIPQAIRNCKAFVLILSEICQTSRWVPRELDQAINEGKTILPFMLENCPLRDDFSFYLTNVQRYAAYENMNATLELLIRDIMAILGREADNIYIPVPESEESSAPLEEKSFEPAPEAAYAPASKPTPAPASTVKKKGNKKKFLIPLIAVLGSIALIAALIITFSLIGKASRFTIAGKEYKKSDTSVWIDGAEITKEDIENFKLFKELNSVNITNSTLPDTDIGEFVEGLKYTLTLSNCGITDEHIATVDFSKCTLTSVDLSNNPGITDLSCLSVMGEELDELNISGTGVVDISFVSSLTGLRDFSAAGNGISDISALSSLTELSILDLSENCLSDSALESLSDCVELWEINVSYNGLKNLNGLEKCLELYDINAAGNSLENINGLDNATRLTDVMLAYCPELYSVDVLKKSEKTLKRVNISGCSITDLDTFMECTELIILFADDTYIDGADLEALVKCTALKEFSAVSCNIDSLNGLRNCTQLDYLNVSQNMLTSTVGFNSACTETDVYADFSDNRIEELTIPSLNYSFLDVCLNNIEDHGDLNAASGAYLALDYNESIDLAALAAADYGEIYIVDCPLDKQLDVEDALGSYKVYFMTESEVRESMSEQE